jgi:hypothetical protein
VGSQRLSIIRLSSYRKLRRNKGMLHESKRPPVRVAAEWSTAFLLETRNLLNCLGQNRLVGYVDVKGDRERNRLAIQLTCGIANIADSSSYALASRRVGFAKNLDILRNASGINCELNRDRSRHAHHSAWCDGQGRQADRSNEAGEYTGSNSIYSGGLEGKRRSINRCNQVRNTSVNSLCGCEHGKGEDSSGEDFAH